MVRSLLRWRRTDMEGVVEAHFWSLTRYRIGRYFLGLDYADNIIFFPAYRKKTWGGWAAVTLSGTHTDYLTNDTSVVNILEDGYPLHWRASTKLQLFIAEENKIWKKKLQEELLKRVTTISSTAKMDNNNNNNDEEKGKNEDTYRYDNEHQFRDALIIKCTSSRFAKRYLRLNRLITILYKFIYFYLWCILLSICFQAYLLFRSWLNPPARKGLKNIEDHIMHIPLLLFSCCVFSILWISTQIQPIIDPFMLFFYQYFPSIHWDMLFPEIIVKYIQKLKEEGGGEKGKEIVINNNNNKKGKIMTDVSGTTMTTNKTKWWKLDNEGVNNTWWTQLFLCLLCIFSLLCVL